MITLRATARQVVLGQSLKLTGRVATTPIAAVSLQRKTASGWVRWERTRTRDGRFRVIGYPLAGRNRYRATTKTRRGRVTSRALTLTAVPPTAPEPPAADPPATDPSAADPTPPPAPTTPSCAPAVAPVDPLATADAVCLAATLDSWRTDRVLGVGQQLNVSNDAFVQPITALGGPRPVVVGFDLAEVADAATWGADPVPALLDLARTGSVLTASWHAANPGTAGGYDDRSWTHISDLLDDTTMASGRFWTAYDTALATLARFQAAGVPVLFRPLHEASGGWFWWGRPDPAAYRQLWARMQSRAWAAGVHNLLWVYAAAPRTWDGITDPLLLLPDRVDVSGIDTYDAEHGDPVDRVDLTDLDRLAAASSRVALTEVGPFGSDGSWNPAVISEAVRASGIPVAYAMLWFDDGDGTDEYTGRKAIASLDGGAQWLAGCPSGLCPLN